MALILDAMIYSLQGYSPAESRWWGFVPKSALADRHNPGPRFPRRKLDRDTSRYYKNAQTLARLAASKRAETGEDVVIVFFRDSDGSRSDGPDDWESKRRSMLDGFRREGFATGVPMLPRPKSEAWLLCALHHHQHGCNPLEGRSGNDDSPNSLKGELEVLLAAMGRSPTREDLCEMVRDGGIDWQRIHMPSFDAFYSRLREVIGADRPGDDLASRR